MCLRDQHNIRIRLRHSSSNKCCHFFQWSCPWINWQKIDTCFLTFFYEIKGIDGVYGQRSISFNPYYFFSRASFRDTLAQITSLPALDDSVWHPLPIHSQFKFFLSNMWFSVYTLKISLTIKDTLNLSYFTDVVKNEPDVIICEFPWYK